MESSLVFWLRWVANGLTRGLCMVFNNQPFEACLNTSPASIAAEACVLIRLSPPCPTAGCMVLSTYSFDFTITSELTVLQ